MFHLGVHAGVENVGRRFSGDAANMYGFTGERAGGENPGLIVQVFVGSRGRVEGAEFQIVILVTLC